jgi:protein-S-isoprenylcysteine O-methyltransferase Ste14
MKPLSIERSSTVDASSPRRTRRRTAVRVLLAWLVLPTFFWITGGSVDWWEAWVYCAIVLLPMTVSAVRVARSDPAFLERRFRMRERERTQRRVISWGAGLAVALFVLPGLDRRFGWSAPPRAAVLAAQALVAVGYLGILAVFHANRWAGRTVEVDPGQEVISTGPYAVVRHPMYVTTILLYLATPVALGSWWAVIPGLLLVPVLVARILNEEQVLRRDLPGYPGYAKQVRYRLLPGLW